MQVRDIGIDVKAPGRDPAPGDRMNPFNGTLPVRGSTIVGTVVSVKMQGAVIVEKQHQRYVPKFERYEKRTRRYPAHLPSNIDARLGDEVLIAECRPLSKTINFVVVENRGSQKEARKEAPKVVKPKAPKTPKAVKAPRVKAEKTEAPKAESKPEAAKPAKKDAKAKPAKAEKPKKADKEA